MSRAFPGWRATALHAAMNEAEPSGWTHAVLEHLRRTLGERDGTGPDDDPLPGSLRDESRAEGEARGLAQAVREILRARGVACPEDPCAGIPDGVPSGAGVAAVLACDSAEDFHARLRARVGTGPAPHRGAARRRSWRWPPRACSRRVRRAGSRI